MYTTYKKRILTSMQLSQQVNQFLLSKKIIKFAIIMKQQNSLAGAPNLLLQDEPDFSNNPISPQANGGSVSINATGSGAINIQADAILNKFNNTVVLKKGQLTQVLKNSLAISSGQGATGNNGGLSTNNASLIYNANMEMSPQRGGVVVSNGGGGSVPRRNSRNINKNQQPVITTASNAQAQKDQFGFAQSPHHLVGGPEISIGEDGSGGGVIGKSLVGAGNLVSLDHFQYLNGNNNTQQAPQLQLMNQTIRSPQQQNLAVVMNNIKNNGSLRNLQNFRSKRMEKVQQQQIQYLGSLQGQDSSNQVVRAPPIQNGLYFSNIISNTNNSNNGGAQSQRYHPQQNSTQPLQTAGGQSTNQILSPQQQQQHPRQHHNNSKSNGPLPSQQQQNHQKTQSMGDVTGILKNIITAANTNQMPNIIASPRNPVSLQVSGGNNGGGSIERINKNISDSINSNKGGNPHNKEIQLIQAYQHQKWKEQITQRKNKNVALRSLDQTYQDLGSAVNGASNPANQYVINTSREPSTKPSLHQGQSLNTSIVNIAQAANGSVGKGPNSQRQRIIQAGNAANGPGNLTSRVPQGGGGHQLQFTEGGNVFSYHDQSTYSSTIEDESRMMKTQIKFPMTSQEAFKILQPLLWDYEKTELLEFETVYFFNVVERKKQSSEQRRTQASGGSTSTMMIMGSDNPKLINFGFDNENQEYNVIMHEHLAYRYEIVKKLGKGSFGIVLRVFDHKTKEFVALKILKNKKRLYKQGLVEAKLIETLNKSDPEDKKNIIRKLDQFVFRKHLMITFEMLSINLYEFIKMNNFQGFSLNLIKRFAIQILIALFFMKEHNIVHCDMKPENILLRKINKSGIKIIDFGSGCFENEKIYTYIQSRFYRAPEIVLGIPYTTAIDMWSYGCILYELFVGYPLFPGEDEKEHMAMIMEVKGVPPRSVLARATRRKVFFDDDYQPILVANSRGKIRNPLTKSLPALMNCQDRDFVDFVDKCIEWKVENRLSPEQAFSHPFIAKAVQELKGIRGSSETQKPANGTGSQQQHHQTPVSNGQVNSNGSGNTGNTLQQQHAQKDLQLHGATSNSETLLPQINYKQ